MLNLDRYNDACEIVLTRSIPIWKRFAQDTTDANEKKNYFSRALQNLEQLIEILGERWRSIRTNISHHDVRRNRKSFLFSSNIFFVLLD